MKSLFKVIIVIAVAAGLVLAAVLFTRKKPDSGTGLPAVQTQAQINPVEQKSPTEEVSSPMDIAALRQRQYPGGDFAIEQTLPNGTNYRQFIASYRSEGFKIYGLLTVPLSPKPEGGFPAVLFVHGHIPPKQYSTTDNYPTYQATLARSGLVTFKPDLRGHGRSEGEAVGAHFSEAYLVDALSAIAYMKNYSDINPERIGYWGHSNGGETGLRASVVTPDVKAYVLWAGVVGSFEDELETFNAKIPFMRDVADNPLVREHGLPSQNPDFWKKIDPYSYLNDISAPMQLHHGTLDKSVPIELSLHLKAELEKLGKKVEYFDYPGDDHNIGTNSGLAWQRSIKFFKENL